MVRCVRAAQRYGPVIIVTESNEKWVRCTAELVFPGAAAECLRQVEVLSSKERFAQEFPGEPGCWQIAAFSYVTNRHLLGTEIPAGGAGAGARADADADGVRSSAAHTQKKGGGGGGGGANEIIVADATAQHDGVRLRDAAADGEMLVEARVTGGTRGGGRAGTDGNGAVVRRRRRKVAAAATDENIGMLVAISTSSRAKEDKLAMRTLRDHHPKVVGKTVALIKRPTAKELRGQLDLLSSSFASLFGHPSTSARPRIRASSDAEGKMPAATKYSTVPVAAARTTTTTTATAATTPTMTPTAATSASTAAAKQETSEERSSRPVTTKHPSGVATVGSCNGGSCRGGASPASSSATTPATTPPAGWERGNAAAADGGAGSGAAPPALSPAFLSVGSGHAPPLNTLQLDHHCHPNQHRTRNTSGGDPNTNHVMARKPIERCDTSGTNTTDTNTVETSHNVDADGEFVSWAETPHGSSHWYPSIGSPGDVTTAYSSTFGAFGAFGNGVAFSSGGGCCEMRYLRMLSTSTGLSDTGDGDDLDSDDVSDDCETDECQSDEEEYRGEAEPKATAKQRTARSQNPGTNIVASGETWGNGDAEAASASNIGAPPFG